jgi:F1F0 ATPase subunit 2
MPGAGWHKKEKMIEAPALLLALLVGIVLGTIFFGGLWWTIRLGICSPWAAVWFLGSLLLRTSITLAGFYFVSQGDWRKVLACMGGFLVARLSVTLFTRAAFSPAPPCQRGAL